MKVWSWRQAVVKSSIISPSTKHVLLTLSIYMNEVGGGCYPSVETLSADTGLSCKTVIGALNMAEVSGFINKFKHGYAGKTWARNEYFAQYPSDKLFYGIVPQSKTASDKKKHLARKTVSNALNLGNLVKKPCCVCGEDKSEAHHIDYDNPLDVYWLCRKHHSAITRLEKKLVTNYEENFITERGENISPNNETVVKTFPNGGENISPDVVKPFHTNSSEELFSSNKKEDTKVSSKKEYPDDFEYWWSIFPRQRRGSKTKAFTAWKTATKENNPEDIINGTEQYATSDEVKRGYAKGAAAWLNDNRWEVDYRPAESKLQKSSDLAMDIVNRFNDNPWE